MLERADTGHQGPVSKTLFGKTFAEFSYMLGRKAAKLVPAQKKFWAVVAEQTGGRVVRSRRGCDGPHQRRGGALRQVAQQPPRTDPGSWPPEQGRRVTQGQEGTVERH